MSRTDGHVILIGWRFFHHAVLSQCLLLAQSGHIDRGNECLLSGGKRTLRRRTAMSAFDPKRKWLTAIKVLVLRGRLKNPNLCGIAASRTDNKEELIELWNIE